MAEQRLVDANAILYVEAVDGDTFEGTGKLYAQKKDIDALPTIEERKVGKWNRRKGMYEVGFKCSECNSFSIAETPYCSFCGARMVQEGAEHETDRS